MILNPLATHKNGFSYRVMHVSAEKCIFPEKNALACRKCLFLQKMHFCGKTRFSEGAHHKKLQEISGGLQAQESKTPANFHKIEGFLEGSLKEVLKGSAS